MDKSARIEEVEVRVREMLGASGDLILVDPKTLHAPAPDALATPRMMLTQFVYAAA